MFKKFRHESSLSEIPHQLKKKLTNSLEYEYAKPLARLQHYNSLHSIIDELQISDSKLP